jgi:hypothetical protein
MQNLGLPLLLACAGCFGLLRSGAAAAAQTVTGSPEPALSQVVSNPTAGNATCRDYSTLATVDGRQLPISGRACQQSDGTWRIAEGTPANPYQYVATYQPTPAAYDEYGEPLLWAFPIGFSIGLPFFIDLHDHFHRFHDFDHFRHVGGFGRGEHFGGFHGGFGHR